MVGTIPDSWGLLIVVFLITFVTLIIIWIIVDGGECISNIFEHAAKVVEKGSNVPEEDGA